MQVRDWLDNLIESTGRDEEIPLRVILKSGNELAVSWSAANDVYGSADELTDGEYMIDMRSVAAIQWLIDH